MVRKLTDKQLDAIAEKVTKAIWLHTAPDNWDDKRANRVAAIVKAELERVIRFVTTNRCPNAGDTNKHPCEYCD